MEETTQNTSEQPKSEKIMDQLNEKLGDFKEKAGEALDTAEDKAKELWIRLATVK